jgi:hypothetical protein
MEQIAEQNVVNSSTPIIQPQAVTKRCPVDATRLVQQTDPDFGLCWVCPTCGYIEPIL